MRTAQGQPVRLDDYRIPDFLVDTVDLDISLDREATRVVATLAPRPIGLTAIRIIAPAFVVLAVVVAASGRATHSAARCAL